MDVILGSRSPSTSPDWWEPQSYGLALATALLSTICWGSWSNTAKAAGGVVNFAHYYVDYCFGTVLVALVLFIGPGTRELGGPEVDLTNAVFALAAGAVFGVANLMLTTGIALGGISVAFPICIGTALVLGTVLTYVIDKRGDIHLLFPGVAFALLGVLCNARAYALLQRARQPAQSQPAAVDARACLTGNQDVADGDAVLRPSSFTANPSTVRILLICGVGGVLMSCWAPLSAQAIKGERGLSPYSSFVFFTIASLVAGLGVVSGQQCCCAVLPRVDAVTSATAYAQLPPPLHCWGLLGGAVWALGTLANLVSGGHLGFALSYALGQTAPVVAVLWGLCWYREFHGAPWEAFVFLCLMFTAFVVAIVLLCLGGR